MDKLSESFGQSDECIPCRAAGIDDGLVVVVVDAIAEEVLSHHPVRRRAMGSRGHAGNVDKMLRQPGEVGAFRPGAATHEPEIFQVSALASRCLASFACGAGTMARA